MPEIASAPEARGLRAAISSFAYKYKVFFQHNIKEIRARKVVLCLWPLLRSGEGFWR